MALPGTQTAMERWRDTAIHDTERIILYLQDHVGELVCMSELRGILHIENIRGRMSDVRTLGYALDAKETLPLCQCHKTQLYRLNQDKPTRPRRVKVHGGIWSHDNWNNLVVNINSTGLAKELTEPEKALIAQKVRKALLEAEQEIEQQRGQAPAGFPTWAGKTPPPPPPSPASDDDEMDWDEFFENMDT